MNLDTTILVSVYNGAKYIDRFHQNLKIHENKVCVLLVDDFSNDGSFELYKSKFKDFNNFTIYRNQNEKGFANALNFGVSLISTKYTVRIDIDDRMSPERINILKTHLIKNNLDLCGSGYVSVDEKGIIKSKRLFPLTNNNIKKTFFKGYFAMGGALILTKTDVFKQIQFDQSMVPSEEFDFFIRSILKGFKLGNVKLHLYEYLAHPLSLSNNSENTLVRVNKYDQILKLNNIIISRFRFNVIKTYYNNKKLNKLNFINIFLFVLLRYIPKYIIK
jgi:GT2 family glycosyltransferase